MNLAVSSSRNVDKKLKIVASNLSVCLNSDSFHEIRLFDKINIETVKPLVGEIILNSGLIADVRASLYRGHQKLIDISGGLQKINTKEKQYIDISCYNQTLNKDFFFLKIENKNNCKANLAICFHGLI
jgi:uncharacterized ubiquitin-like protein YukD